MRFFEQFQEETSSAVPCAVQDAAPSCQWPAKPQERLEKSGSKKRAPNVNLNGENMVKYDVLNSNLNISKPGFVGPAQGAEFKWTHP